MPVSLENLKPYITSLYRVHASHGSFAVPETREIGREIYRKYGRDGMVAVSDAVYDEMGEDLEYEWLCIPWEVLLPRLREMLDRRGLRHIAIVNFDDDPHLTPEQLNERFVRCDDYYVSFKPIDPDWRIYKVEGAPFDRYVREARAGDFYGTPTVSLSKDGKWEMAFGYKQGLLPAEVFDNEQVFLAGLVDCLVRHFAERTYTLRVSVSEDRTVLDYPD